MNTSIARALAVFLMIGAAALAETTGPAFPPDTEVRLATAKAVSSATAKLGEEVELVVVADVMLDEQVAIPKGSLAVGTVVFVRKKAMGGMPGALDLRADYVSLGDQKIRLHSHANARGSRSAAASALVGVGIGILMQGKNVELPAGTELLTYVASPSVSQTAQSLSPDWMPPPMDGKGLVFFFRANDKSNPFLSRQKIKIDDQVVGIMQNDRYFFAHVDPGEHRIESSASIVRLLRIEAGEQVYYQGKVVVGIWLTDTDPDLAQDIIGGLTLSDAAEATQP
jgi:hypothetical protein